MKKSILILLSIIFLGTCKCSETLEVPDPKVGPVSFECEDLIITCANTDKMSDNSFSSSKNKLVISDDGGKTGFEIGCYRLGVARSISVISVSIKAVGAGKRIDQGDRTVILFRDGTRLTFSSRNSVRDATFLISFGSVFGEEEALNELITKEIETMRVWTRKGYVQKDFSNEQSKVLMNTLKCLSQL